MYFKEIPNRAKLLWAVEPADKLSLDWYLKNQELQCDTTHILAGTTATQANCRILLNGVAVFQKQSLVFWYSSDKASTLNKPDCTQTLELVTIGIFAAFKLLLNCHAVLVTTQSFHECSSTLNPECFWVGVNSWAKTIKAQDNFN